MKPALADRLSRAVVGCYPRRWKQRYAAELLDVLDQHRAGPRTVLSLAGGALSTHLDPDYRMQISLKPHLSRDAKLYIAIFAAIIVGVPALVILPMIPRAIRESRWEPSSSDSVDAIAFSRDQRIMVSAAGRAPWEATSTLWDVTDQARPRRLSVFEGGSPTTISPDGATVAVNAFGGRAQAALWNVTRPRHPARLAVLSAGLSGALWGEAFSPDGRILAAASTSRLVLWDVADPARPRLLRSLAAAPLVSDNPGPVPFGVGQGDLVFSPDGRTLASVSGHDQVTVWDVARPARAARIATLAGPGDYFAALAFSPRGNLLAGVTYHGSVLVFRVAGPGRAARVTTRPGILASARFPGGGSTQAGPCGGDCGFAAAYAAGFTPDGRALRVVVDRPEAWPSTAARDTVFTWQVAGSGALSDLTTIFRDVNDAQPTLAPGGRIVADGSLTGGEVHLWTVPRPRPAARTGP
jgi:WD40 repeat protein